MMRHYAFLLALLSLAGCAAQDASVAVPRGDTPNTTIDSGPDLSTILLPVSDDPTVSYNIWFQVGSQDDPPGKEGLAYLTATLLADGGTASNPYEKIVSLLYPLAASYSVSVDREMTTLRGRTHVDNLAAFQPLLTQAYLQPAFDAKDFDRIKSATLTYLEKSLRYAQDEELGKAALYAFVFEGTRYRHPPQGTVAGLKSITLDDVREFYTSHFAGERVVFGLGGAVNDEIVGTIEATRSQLPPGPAAEPVAAPQARAFSGRHVLLVSKPGADASISFGFPIGVHRGDKDYYALWVANSWLGEHRNSVSQLYRVIRSKRGLNYGDYSYIEAFPNGGRRSMPPTNVARRQQIFEVWIRTLPNDQAHFALRAAVRELQDLVDGGMTEEEFALTKAFLRKYSLHFADTTRDRLGYAVDDRFYRIEGSHLEDFRKRIDGLTLADVNDAIKRHLQYKDLKIAIATGTADELKAALVADRPSPIEYAADKPKEVLSEDEHISSYSLGISAQNVQIIDVAKFLEQ